MRNWQIERIYSVDDAAAYFRDMGCSHFHMCREQPARYEEYKSLNIDKATERVWREEAFDDGLTLLVGGTIGRSELWSHHSHLETLVRDLRDAQRLARLTDATRTLADDFAGETRVLVAETLVGRGPQTSPGGMIDLAIALEDADLAQNLADLAVRLTEAASRPDHGSLEGRRAKVHERLRRFEPPLRVTDTKGDI